MFRFTSFYLLFLLSLCRPVSAQDLIVSVDGDSLNCKVLKNNGQTILFSYTEDNETVTRELSAGLFKSVVTGYFSRKEAVVQPESVRIDKLAPTALEVDTSTALAASEKNTPQMNIAALAPEPAVAATQDAPQAAFGSGKWYGGLRAGYANRLFRMGVKYTPQLRDYFSELKSGYGIGISGGYKFARLVGIGINADLYRSVARMRDDSRRDVVSIQYIGPEVMYRKATMGGKSVVFAGFTTGYQVFRQSGQEAGAGFAVRGHGMGWGASTGMDFKISPHAALSLSASALMGALYKYDRTVGKKTETVRLNKDSLEDLSRIALTIGLRFL